VRYNLNYVESVIKLQPSEKSIYCKWCKVCDGLEAIHLNFLTICYVYYCYQFYQLLLSLPFRSVLNV